MTTTQNVNKQLISSYIVNKQLTFNLDMGHMPRFVTSKEVGQDHLGNNFSVKKI